MDQSEAFGQLLMTDNIKCFAMNWLCLLARWDLYWNPIYSLYYYVQTTYLSSCLCGSIRLHV